MELETPYQYIEEIGVMTFSTIYNDKVHSRRYARMSCRGNSGIAYLLI